MTSFTFNGEPITILEPQPQRYVCVRKQVWKGKSLLFIQQGWVPKDGMEITKEAYLVAPCEDHPNGIVMGKAITIPMEFAPKVVKALVELLVLHGPKDKSGKTKKPKPTPPAKSDLPEQEQEL